jgi:kinesin family member 12
MIQRKNTPRSPQSTTGTEIEIGESVRVVVRSRPLNEKEISAGETSCISVTNPQTLQMDLKSGSKNYRFHHVMGEKYTQGQMFTDSGVNVLLDSVLEGYSACVFAYGQTGSGKTYTMAGLEENLAPEDYTSDETDGIIPRSISYLWQNMARRQEQYYVKACFIEIYNEQLKDLLNPTANILHCRWNVKSGFFVEDLLVVDCTNIDDLIAVLHEGIKNRKTSSHELNKDSSRSHSILLIHVVSEEKNEDGHSFKKYGKVSFVDLAGSERLKESKSQGVMIKETGNINRSLFTLGKVISALSNKKKTKGHIPYRDSKLTKLLMDSLGGTSKALMIANISPATVYAEETISTLNYATRAMNIKNKPVIQVDNKEQIIFNLKREIQLLKLENEYLKEQLQRATGGLPPIMIDVARSRALSAKSGNGKLPPISNPPHNQSTKNILEEYAFEIKRLKEENIQISNGKEVFEKQVKSVLIENQLLSGKLSNLEHVFTGITETGDGISNQYTITNVTSM